MCSNFMNNDLQFINIFFRGCSIVAVFPFYLKRKPWHVLLLSSCHSLLIFMLFSAGAVISIDTKIKLVYPDLQTPQLVGDALQFVLDCCFIVTIIYGTLRKAASWNIIFESLAQVDRKLGARGFYIQFNKTYHTIMVALFHGIFISFAIFGICVWTALYEFFLYSNGFHLVVLYYQMIFVMFLFEVTSTLRRRYRCFCKQIINTFCSLNRLEIYEKHVNNEIKDIMLIYKILNDIIKTLNAVCGLSIFLVLSSILANLLNTCNWMLFEYDKSVEKFLTGRDVHYFFLPVYFFVSA